MTTNLYTKTQTVNSLSVGVGKRGIITPSNIFPANIATFDLDFANNQFSGGIQPSTNNSADSRMYYQALTGTTPNYVENLDGSLKTLNTTSALRWSNRGLNIANDRQNRVLQSRDLTQAVWTKTNCTVLKNQTGRTNVANSASQVTVTADGATITQAITVTSLSLYGTIDIKRISGSGTVSMSMDNGTTTTVLSTSSPIFNGICRSGIPVQTLANPTVILTFSTNGDVWLIDFVELSDSGGFENEPVSTVAASVKGWRDRAYADISNNGPLAPWLLSSPTQVFYFEYAQRQNGSLIASDGGIQITSNSSTGFGGTPLTSNKPNFSPDARLNVINKGMCWFSPAGNASCLNGGTVVKDGTPWSPSQITTHWDLGTNGAGNLSTQGMIKRVWFGSVIPSDLVMQAFTT